MPPEGLGDSSQAGGSGDSGAAAGEDDFRRYLPDLSTPRFTTMAKQDAHEYARGFFEGGQPYWLFALYQHWRRLFHEPFKGVTTDGTVRPGLFRLEDEGIEPEPMAAAGQALLDTLTPEQRRRTQLHIDSPEWRSWSNPEFLLSDKGVRLDEVAEAVVEAALALLRACTSPAGYAKALAAMRINGFLGQLVGAPRVMNERSYNVVVFGAPSPTRPWGWAVYGHHLCLNVFLYQRQMVLSPWFTGAEPNRIDAGPHAGTRILHREQALAQRLMRSLSGPLRARAQVYRLLRDDPAMPRGRWNRDDQRHLCGAYRDNRVVPYEGVCAAEMDRRQRDLLWAIAAEYLLYLPERAAAAKLRRLREHEAETYFCWIGECGECGDGDGDGDRDGDGDGDGHAFYFRIQSPLAVLEFDHHSGVFLTNGEPANFHVHTLMRTPNGGDYGMALRPLIPAAEDVFDAVL